MWLFPCSGNGSPQNSERKAAPAYRSFSWRTASQKGSVRFVVSCYSCVLPNSPGPGWGTEVSDFFQARATLASPACCTARRRGGGATNVSLPLRDCRRPVRRPARSRRRTCATRQMVRGECSPLVALTKVRWRASRVWASFWLSLSGAKAAGSDRSTRASRRRNISHRSHPRRCKLRCNLLWHSGSQSSQSPEGNYFLPFNV